MILVNWEEDAKMIVKNFSRKEMERLNAIIAMDIMVRNMNNESAYFTWIYPMRRKTPCFSYGDIRRVHRIYASN